MTAIVKRAASFAETHIDEEVIVMNLDSGNFFSLDGTAAAIWNLIDGVRDRAALLSALGQEFDAPDDELARDLDGFLAELGGVGLIEAA